MKKCICIVGAVCLLLSLTACGDTPPAVSDPAVTTTATTTTTTATTASATTATTTLPQRETLDTLRFTGRVLEVSGSAALMESPDDFVWGDTVWVQFGGVPDVTPQVGDTYTVTYEDMVMLSLPPRVVAVAMEKTN